MSKRKIKKTVVYKNKQGKTKRVTPRQYLAIVERTDETCYYGHFGCAAAEHGPCSHEIEANLHDNELRIDPQ